MEIISINFLIFALIVIGFYYCLNRKAQNYWLFITSVYFFYTWGWPHLIPLFLISTCTFLFGKKLETDHGKKWLLIGIVLNIIFFVFYRVVDSPIFNFAAQAAASTSLSFISKFLIPLGFSFYVLQAISYLVDIYKSKITAETNAVDFFVYMMFFPKVLAGPIERAGNFLPQLKNNRYVDNQKLEQGFTLILVGLFRKIVIAEVLLSILPSDYIHATVINTHPSLGIFSFPFFSYAESIPYLHRLVGIVAYGIYLYNDFAGYTGIVRGISLLMGFNLVPNFQTPYFSSSLSDFWARWHISLSSWLRDYIYFPLTRFLKKKNSGQSAFVPVVIPLVATMLISGVWHGMTIPLLLWGLTYGVIMVMEQFAFQRWPFLRPQQQSKPVKIFAQFLTFVVVTLAWVPFTANSVEEILAFWKVIFKGSGWNSLPDINFMIPVLIVISFLLDFFQSRFKDEPFIIRWPLLARASALAFFILTFILASTWTSEYVSKVFIYQGF